MLLQIERGVYDEDVQHAGDTDAIDEANWLDADIETGEVNGIDAGIVAGVDSGIDATCEDNGTHGAASVVAAGGSEATVAEKRQTRQSNN